MVLNTIAFKIKPLVIVNTATDNAMSSLRVRSRFYGRVRVTRLFSFILQSVHLLYKYAIRIIFCFIRTRRIHFSAYE
jgi:hypothetical protein